MSGVCTRRCKGARSALEGPAKYGRTPGRKLIWCPCCETELQLVNEQDYAEYVRQSRLAPGVRPESAQLFQCVPCGYDVVSMAGLVPTP